MSNSSWAKSGAVDDPWPLRMALAVAAFLFLIGAIALAIADAFGPSLAATIAEAIGVGAITVAVFELMLPFVARRISAQMTAEQRRLASEVAGLLAQAEELKARMAKQTEAVDTFLRDVKLDEIRRQVNWIHGHLQREADLALKAELRQAELRQASSAQEGGTPRDDDP